MKVKREDEVKKRLGKKNFYLPILDELKIDTNLTRIQEKLSISKQQLNYYLRQLQKNGFIFNKGHGWWEVTEKSKNMTKYGIFLKKDSIRGHAYIWEVKIEKIPENWSKRIEILKEKKINFKVVGAKENTPRIKVLGRKVWLCNDHLRIYDTEKSSYYGNDAIESQKNSKFQAMRIVHTLENKLGIRLNPDKIIFKREHYALIKNDLAIDQNQKGIIWRIKDENGDEWLLIDDSLGEGGELENIGKSAFKTNPKMQKWWNEQIEDDFGTTPKLIKKKFKETEENISEVSGLVLKSSKEQINTAMLINQMQLNIKGLTETVYQLIEVIKRDKEK